MKSLYSPGSWCASLQRQFALGRMKQSRKRVSSSNWARSEWLEQRTLLSGVSWNTDNSGFWDDAENWDGGTVPGASDDVTIDRGTANPTITFRTGTNTVNSMTSNEAFAITGGSLTVSAASSFNSGLSLSGGNLTANAPAALTLAGMTSWADGTLTGTIINHGTFTTTGDSNLTFTGNLSGPGSLNKSGAGTLTLSGVNTYTGDTLIQGGTLKLGAAGAISDYSDVTMSSGTTLDLNGFSETIDAIHGVGGTVTSSAPGAVTLTVGFSSDTAPNFQGVIQNGSGTVGLTKIGAGNQTLGGANTYTGATTVNNGSITVTGSTVSSDTTVNAGGTLKGAGTTGSVTVNSGGTLAPGMSPGILNTGILTLTPGSTYTVELNGTTAGTGYDQINVTGTVSLGGATLSTLLGFTPTAGNSFTIINNDGSEAVSGTFNGLAQNAAFKVGSTLFQISYTGGDGNDVVLTSGNALQFDGNDYAITPNLKSAFPSDTVTFEVWFKPNGAGVIVSEVGQSTINSAWHDSQLEILTSGEVKARVWNLTPVSLGFAGFGDWHHAVVRYDSATQTLDGFLNGVKSIGATTGTTRSSPSAQYYALGAPDSTNLGSGGIGFNGQMDEFRVWNTARTESDITGSANKQLTGSESGLVAYYRLDDGTSTTITDLTVNNFNGSFGAVSGISVGVTGALTGDSNTAYQFSGGQIPVNIPQLNTATGTTNTVSFWMNWNGTDGIMPIGFTTYDLWLQSGRFGFNTGQGDIWGISNPVNLANNWHHITAVFQNGNATQSQLWIDGVQQTLTQQFGTTSTARNITTVARISGWTNDSGYRFQGSLDEVAFFNRTLSATEIAAQYNARNSGTYSSTTLNQTPIAYYRLGEASGSGTAVDSSGNGYDGNFDSTPTWVTSTALLYATPPTSLVLNVINTADSGPGSLRQAILDANAAHVFNSSGTIPVTISFNITTTDSGYNAASGVYTITPNSALPIVNHSRTSIDGYTQSGASANTLSTGSNAVIIVALDGVNAGIGASGLTINGANSTVRGLSIYGFSANGINVSGGGATGNVISGNVIGINPAGGIPLTTGGVSWWRGQNTTGDWLDGNTGTLLGNSSYIAGKVGQAFRFDGSGDSVNLNNPGNLRLQTFTIEGWVRRGSSTLATADGSGAGQVFGYGANGYGLGLLNDGTITLSQVGGSSVNTGAVKVADTNFHHLAVTKSGTSVVFYIDGIATTAQTFIPTFTFTTNVAIGARQDTGTQSFLGDIDELAVYNRALAAGEVQAINTAGSVGKHVGNAQQGILVSNGGNNLIGTNGDGVNDAGERNVISGNSGSGIVISANPLTALGSVSIADKLLSGQLSSSTMTGTIAQADLNDFTSQVAGNWSINNPIPGGGGDFYAVKGTGTLLVNTAGTYSFALGSNDGSRLRIDGNQIVIFDTPRAFGVTYGVATLSAGVHSFEWVSYEQGGAAGFELSVAAGTNASAVTSANGWRVVGDNTLPGNGIQLQGSIAVTVSYSAAKNVVAGNYIGTNAAGTAVLGNAGTAGILIQSGSRGNLIGTNGDGISDTTERNLISGNLQRGVWISASHQNVVAGNDIGTNAAGTAALANVYDGIIVTSGSFGNLFGTNGDGINDAAERNIISGNGNWGIRIQEANSINNVVAGNYIGTNAAGTAAIANAIDGVLLYFNAQSNLIGTNGDGVNDAAERNIISGNSQRGVRIQQAQNNTVAGNFIGTDVNQAALPNNSDGVWIWSAGVSSPAATGNTIGGGSSTQANVIAFNKGAGINVWDAATTGNSVLHNSIYSNTSLGIDLNNDGVTRNDANDADTGPNGLLNFAVITSARLDVNGNLVVKGFARAGSVIELFISDSDPTGFGEGKTFLTTLTEGSAADTDSSTGTYNYTSIGTDTTDQFTFSIPVPVGVSAGTLLAASATLSGSTSEFSRNITVRDAAGNPANAPPTISITGAPTGVTTEGTPVNLTAVIAEPGIYTYAWTIYRNGVVYTTGTGANFTFTPGSGGTYSATLTVTDDGGVSQTTTVGVGARPPLGTFFSTDFASGAPAQFSGVTTTESVQGYAGVGTGTNVFAGSFLRNTAAGPAVGQPVAATILTLTGLPAHTSIDLNFLLAIVDSWDGAGTYGPDTFTVQVDGTTVFSQAPRGGYVPPPGGRLASFATLGFNSGFADDAYNMGLEPAFKNIPHTASTLTIKWFANSLPPSSFGFQGGGDESWALDNVEVALFGPATVNNVAPTVTAAANQTANEGAATSFNLGSFTDPGTDNPWTVEVNWGDSTSPTTFTAATTGALTSQSHTYADDGSYSVTVTVTDNDSVPVSKSFQITVANVAPTANADTGSTSEDEILNVAAPGVLGNDTDPAGANDPLTVTGFSVVSAKGAAVLVDASGSYSYDPRNSRDLQSLRAGQTTTDTFSYTIADGDGGTASATVTVTVTGVNDAPVLDVFAAPAVVKTDTLIFDVADASDVDLGDALTFSLVGAPLGATIDPRSGVLTWAPTEDRGPGAFEFSVRVTDDGNPELSDEKLITITTLAAGIVNGNLLVVGTSIADTFVISSPDPTHASVTVNGNFAGNFDIPVGGQIVVMGYGGSDRLTVDGTAQSDSFVVTANSIAGPGAVVTHNSVESLTILGLAGDDSFRVDASLALPLSIDGGDSTSGDSLIAPEQSNNWSVTGAGSGTLNGFVQFGGVEHLVGGTNTDAFVLGGGTISGSINGSGGSDTLTANNMSNTWTVSAPDAGIVTGVGAFANIEHLVGGSSTDSFVLGGGTISGSISGSGGSDTLTGDNVANVWTITAAGGGSVTGVGSFAGIEHLIGGTNTDSFVLGGGTISGSISGSGGSDTLTANNVTNTWTVNGADAGSVTGVGAFANIEHLVGGTSTDAFILGGGTISGSINGSGGSDTLRGDNVANVWSITAAGGGSVTGVGSFAGIENLIGGTQVDSFTVAGGALGGSINGSDGNDSVSIFGTIGNDAIEISGATVSSGGATVTLSRLENLTISGAEGNDVVTVAAATSYAGSVSVTGETVSVHGAISSTAGGNLAVSASSSYSQSAAITAAGLGSVTVTSGGAITMSTAATTTSGTGSITLSAGTNAVIATISTAGGVSISAGSGSITDGNGPATNVNAASLSMSAGGTIHSDTAVVTLAASAGGTVSIDETDDVALGTVTSTAASVTITAGGSITDGNLGAINITGSDLLLTAGTGIGSFVDPLDTTVSTLTATGGSGGIFISNTGLLEVLGATAFGDIDITTHSPMIVSGAVRSTTGNITLTTGDSLGSGDNLTLAPTAVVESTTGTIALQAGDDLVLQANSFVHAEEAVSIKSDFGDADPGVGGKLQLAGELQSDNSPIAIGGGADADTYSLAFTSSGAGTGGGGKSFGFEPGAAGKGSVFAFTDYGGANVLDFSGATAGIQFNLGLFNGEEQTVDGNNRMAVKGNFGAIVGTQFADQFSVPAPSRSRGEDPNDLFGLSAGLTASLYDKLVDSGALASFGDTLSGDEIGTVMGIFGGEDGLSSAELGLVLGAFGRTVDTGGGDDRVSAGLFTTVDLGDGDNQFVDTTDAAELGALLGVFENGGLSADELGVVLGVFSVTVTAGSGDDSARGGLFSNIDLGNGNNLFTDTSDASQLGEVLGVFLADESLTAAEVGTMLGVFLADGDITSEAIGTVLGVFAADGTLTSAEIGTVLGVFSDGAIDSNEVGTVLGVFADDGDLSASEVGAVLGIFGADGTLTEAELGAVLGVFGETATPVEVAAVLGIFEGTATQADLGTILGIFNDDRVITTDELGAILGIFSADGTISADEVGTVLGIFGADGVLTSSELGTVLGVFGIDGELSSDQLGSVLGIFGTDGEISSDELGTVLGVFLGEGELSADEVGTLLGVFGDGVASPSEIGELLGIFSADGTLTEAELGTVLGVFLADGSLTSDELGTVLGVFANGTIETSEIGTVLGIFGGDGDLSAADVGLVLGLFGADGTLTEAELGAVLGVFGENATPDEVAAVLGIFEGMATPADLGTILGIFGGDGTLTAGEVGAVLGIFSTDGSLSDAELGAVLGVFGADGSVSADDLGTLLGVFLASADTSADELGSVLGVFIDGGLVASEIGDVLGIFNADGTLSSDELGSLLGIFAAEGELTSGEVGTVLGIFSDGTIDPSEVGTVLGIFGGDGELSASDVGAVMGIFLADGGLTAEELGSVLGVFDVGLGSGSDEVGTLLGIFSTDGVVSDSEIGQVLGIFMGDSAPTAADLQAVLGIFSDAGLLTGADLGTLLGIFGGVETPGGLSEVLGIFGDDSTSESELTQLLGVFDGGITPDEVGTVLGIFGDDGLTPSELVTVLGIFSEDAGLTANELGSVLGVFLVDGQISADELGTVLGIFSGDGDLTAGEIGAILGIFAADGSLSDTEVGALLGVFNADGSVSTDEVGILLGLFLGDTAPSSEDLGAVLGIFGSLDTAEFGTIVGLFDGGVTVDDVGELLGVFSDAGTLSDAELGAVLGVFESNGDLTSSEVSQLLGIFGNSGELTGAEIGTVLGVFNNDGDLSASEVGAVLGLFIEDGGLTSSELGALLGVFDSMITAEEIGVVLGVFANGTIETSEIGTVLGIFNDDGTLTADELGAVLGIFGVDGDISATELSAVLGVFNDDGLTSAEIGVVLGVYLGDANITADEIGAVLGVFGDGAVDPAEVGTVLGIYIQRQAAAVNTLLGRLGSIVKTGDGHDVVSAGAAGTYDTGAGDDTIIIGLQQTAAAFSNKKFAGRPAKFIGGAGSDTYYVLGSNVGHLSFVEKSTDAGTDTLNFSSFTGGPVHLDLSSITEQEAAAGKLWITFSSGMAFDNVIGSADADTIIGNDLDNRLSGADFLDNRAGSGPVWNGRTQVVFLDFDSETNQPDDTAAEHVYSAVERSEIRARLENAYGPFGHFRFTESLAEATQLAAGLAGGPDDFASIIFNQFGTNGLPGGQSQEIDFRNTNFKTTVVVNVNGFLGSKAGQLADTSANLVGLSATIAVHELAHSLGGRHGDALGPIGFGIHMPPGPHKFAPEYSGPVGAFETIFHNMASPASVGSKLADAAGQPFFSEREAIRIAFANQWTAGVNFLSEVTPTQGPIFKAQSLGELPGLDVPNTLVKGLNAGREFAVAAIVVAGSIGLSADGHSESDFYSFSGLKGDLINMEIISFANDRIRTLLGSIDSILRVFNSSGDLIAYYAAPAYNDDSFEPTDSSIVDLVLPADGMYYVEVDTFAFHPGTPGHTSFCASGGPAFGSDACNDTDTGSYELFIYRFDAGNATDGGDTIDGRGGNDELVGGIGNDKLTGGTGQNRLYGGDDIDTVVETGDVDFSLANSSLQFGTASELLFNVENAVLTGGSSDNTFTTSGWTGGGLLSGLEGSDKVVAGKDNDFTLTNSSLATTDGMALGLTNIELAVLTGGASNNRIDASAFTGQVTLDGGAGNDVLLGGTGNDQFTGGLGNDSIDGGGGTDRLVESGDVDFTLTNNSLTGLGSDVLVSIERATLTGGDSANLLDASGFSGDVVLVGGKGNDQITGGSGNDVLIGGDGDDMLVGASGNDVLVGGYGSDRMVGSVGHDILVAGETKSALSYDDLREIGDKWASAFTQDDGLNTSGDSEAIIDEAFSVDKLTGSSGHDWFILDTSHDRITDLLKDLARDDDRITNTY